MKVVIVIPVYNEELALEKNIIKLFNFVKKNLTADWQIIIADNNSTDRTSEIAKRLSAKFSNIDSLFISQKGKGIAIKSAWQQSEADVYCFMDADLATNLEALPLLIEGIQDGYDLVIGSRSHHASKVSRSLIRKIISFCYRLVLKTILRSKINDAPCGFKAINNKVKENILPQIKNKKWFFDSEMLILAEKSGYKIKEIPIVWKDIREGQDKSKVKVISLSIAYFKEVLALRKRLK